MTSSDPQRTLHLVSLGCPKNRVDAERMAGLARRHGLELVADPAQAEVLLVNTCGFVMQASEESIDTVLDLAQLKQTGRCRKLIMAGCLPQRHPRELAAELPEVDHFIGAADLDALDRILAGDDARQAVGRPGESTEEQYERLLVDTPHSAYLKIAEGCDRPCAFCVIPQLRGAQRSRAVGSLTDEARALVDAGAQELVLVAQDSTAYGHDLQPAAHLAELLEALDRLPGVRWIRLLYAYPSAVDRRLMEALAGLKSVVKYLDMPIQHIDDEVLRRMRRGYSGDRVRRCVDQLRQAIPDLALRTTLLAGHPGETPAAHQAMLRFVNEYQIDHLGVFAFSPEQGADAATQPDQLPAELAAQRVAELMEAQRRVSQRLLARKVGQRLDVLVEGPSQESEYLMEGRHAGQAPEVDGVVYLTDGGGIVGDFLPVEIIDSGDYDLVGRPSNVP